MDIISYSLFLFTADLALTDFQNGLLLPYSPYVSSFLTPIIGRMSDKYWPEASPGSIAAGTALSFIIMAFAPNAIFLFIARGS